MEEMETFLLQLELGLINLEDKVNRLTILLENLKDQGVLEQMQRVYNKTGIDLPINQN